MALSLILTVKVILTLILPHFISAFVTHEDERTVLYKTKSLGTKPILTLKTNPDLNI